ncbi:MAG: amidohydrolase family protein [Sphingobacteriaceae bacterium]|nr:amidohydrolase family protein [Sphingobacteriaceae bacterium]
MVNYYNADFILTATSEPLKNGTVAVGEGGTIMGVYHDESPELEGVNITKLDGIIVPGFINSHCHLELSHLHNKIPQKEGLLSFIKKVINFRKTARSTQATMQKADQQMWENGIVAVADIANTLDSKKVKEASPIYYYTFVELISFEPEKAKDAFRSGAELLEQFSPLHASIAPHAPYSASKELFRYIGKFCGETGSPVTIHNQESEDENKLYRYKSGEFLNFYKELGINIDFFKPQARNSIQSIIPLIPIQQRTMLVHNTYTSLKDIYFILRSGRLVTWCFCPNANLHIENRLPKVEMFQYHDFNITLGTDSLASNDKLCILSELKTLHQNFPNLSLQETINWATINGAKFLGIDTVFGSIEKGKKPGLNLISNVKGLKLSPESKIKKLV